MVETGNSCSAATSKWLAALVQHETVSGSNSNLALLDEVESYLRQFGFEIRRTHSRDGKRANVFATLGANGTAGLVLSGHTDVVPASGQNWSYPPFKLVEEEDRFYGRGTSDMKGFLAAVLATVERIGPKNLPRPLHLAFTYDEEIGCIGVRDLLSDLAQHGIRPSACVIGEPTRMRVVRAHKGRNVWRCRVHGQAAHSSFSGLGVNAAEAACRLVTDIAEEANILQKSPLDDSFYVPFSTMATCCVSAGKTSNVIPEVAEFDFDLRYLPEADPGAIFSKIQGRADSIQKGMRERVTQSKIDIEPRSAVPALKDNLKNRAVIEMLLRAGAILGSNIAYTTEGGLYQAQGIPTVVCGPGDIAQAHTADEFILKSELVACETFLYRLLTETLE